MAIPLTLKQFDNLAEPILNEVFFAGYDSTMQQGMSVLDLFGMRDPGNKRYAYTQSLGGIGYFKKREEGKGVNMEEMEQLFKETFEMVEYSEVVPIDKNMVEDQNYLGINEIVTALGVGAAKTRRDHAASVFYNGFDTTGADGKYLFATDHPLDKDGTNEHGNLGTSALSYDAVSTAIQKMILFKDSRNKPAPSIGDTLVVPASLWEQAVQITANVNQSDTGDRNINAIRARGGMRLIIDPYLDVQDANNWFVVDSVLAQRYLLWFNRKQPTFGVDIPTKTDPNYYAAGEMRYDFGYSDWRWAYGNAVS